MTWPEHNHVYLKDLFIDRKMLVILAIFVILGLSLVGTIILATNTLSSLRAFSTIQTYWTEARKDALYELINFTETGNEQHLSGFHSSLELIHDARNLRLELMKESPDYNMVRELMVKIDVNPNDISSMIVTYERLHSFAHLSNVVSTWNEADSLIQDLVNLSQEIENLISRNELSNQLAQYYISRIHEINDEFRQHKDLTAAGLSDGTRLLRLVIIWVSVTLGAILVISGLLLSYRFLKRIKRWAGIVEISEQRYKSLFEYNPNAVFSLDKEGLIVSVNDAFERISGYFRKDIERKKFNTLLPLSVREDIEGKVSQVLKGNPQNYETHWVKKDGNTITVHITMLPIYVDKNIEGVFAIAEDISFQKYAEEKIKHQLDEKTFLLSEIHDRVKNNLALISSLLQLQSSYVDDPSVHDHLNSTVSRIHSMAMVHERLYQTDNFANIRMDEFIHKLTEHIKTSLNSLSSTIEIVIDSDPVTLDIKQAVPSGLILNELISNSFKYAFNGSDVGKLKVSLHKKGSQITVGVKDNGKGLPENFDLNTQSTLGMTLVKSLINQLNAKLMIENCNGTCVTFSFQSRKLSNI